MKQVAHKARVSTTTVSHVLNNTRAVHEDTRARVLAAIAELRYIPSAVARSLKNDRTHTLGMMIPNNSNPYFAELIQGIEDAAFARGYNIILCNAYDDAQKQLDYIRVLTAKRIDGLILVSSGSDPALSALLAELAMPIVLVDREVLGVQADFIESDHWQGGYQACRHLLALGHRRIACVAGPENLLPSRDRVAGYRAALEEAGLQWRSAYLVHADFTSQGGFLAFQHLLALPERPSAIFASNDLMAIGGLCAAQQAGVRIPEDLSVIGYDDIALAQFATPPLTSIAQPKAEIGQRAAHTLIDRLQHPPASWCREKLHTRLIVRQSCAAPSAEQTSRTGSKRA